ncbi:MAG: hypothetical protein ACREF7_03195 [Candidatus Saccharimonadales bacterium]
MAKTIKGDLVLEADTEFGESIIVEGSILGKDGARYNLRVKGDLSAQNVSARNVSARNIVVRDVSAWNVSARNVSAGDISAGDISAKGKISYYGVCFAYYNIKCKSIKGSRKNAKHFVLDGKVEISGE